MVTSAPFFAAADNNWAARCHAWRNWTPSGKHSGSVNVASSSLAREPPLQHIVRYNGRNMCQRYLAAGVIACPTP
jgi:hypothetical protein